MNNNEYLHTFRSGMIDSSQQWSSSVLKQDQKITSGVLKMGSGMSSLEIGIDYFEQRVKNKNI